MKTRKKRSKIWLMDKCELEQIVKSSDTLSKILKTLGFSNKGGNCKTLKSRMEEDEIDYSHIKLGQNSNLGKKFNVEKIPLEKILTTNSTYNRFNLKKRLVKEDLLEYRCDNCGLEDVWQGTSLSLQLEHRNGVSDDNRIENLCFLCPNCHSQTDTYAGKSLRKLKKRCLCGKEMCKNSKSCNSCNQVKTRKVQRPTKKVLEKEMKENSWVSLGKKYGVSDNAVRKWAKQYRLL